MIPLPIDPYLPRITDLLRSHGALVLTGPPGSGKTTRAPPAILERSLRSKGRLLLLEPRRVAARAAAARIASERGWTLGREVGYTVRFENRTRPDTALQVLTEGIFTRILRENPFLEGISAVILDEFHERSIHTDLALALIREIRRAGRDDLLVLVLSATLDPGPVAEFLGGSPVLEVEGRPHPVEIRYLDRPERSEADALAARVLRQAWKESRGNALLFLPGIREIRRTLRELEAFARSEGALLVPLHGSLSLDEQIRALSPSDRRKIVLSTNIAETSLTIEGVDLVVDTGYARILRNDPRHGIDRLEVERISKYSAEQRAGRAGRTGPGLAVRLWTRTEHEDLREREEPEIRRVDLASAALELRSFGISDPSRFEWFEPPDPAALERAEGLLLDLGAIERPRGPLTAAGKAMLGIPSHPRLSRILIAAHERGLLREGAALAALIEERDIIPISAAGRSGGTRGSAFEGGSSERGPSDLLRRLDLLEEAEAGGFRQGSPPGVDPQAARAAARARDLLLREALAALESESRGGGRRRSGGERREDMDLLRAVLAGYPDRVVRRRAKGGDRGRMVGGRGVLLSPASVVRDEPFFIAVDLDEGARGERLEARVNLASAIRRSWLEEDFPRSISEVKETVFEAEAEKVRSTATLCYRDLPLEEPRDMRPDAPIAEKLLAEASRPRAEEIFAANEDCARWLARARSLREWMPELGLPPFDGNDLSEAIAGACAGKTSLDEVRRSDLLGILQARLSFEVKRAIDDFAPEAIQAPSGSRIRLAYEPGKPPVLAVRLQEMFGLAETPAVARGRVPVLLHLLGPNFRPVQITRDLRSFWNTTYAQVRKDLRARYPKHSWPEDPWTAEPTSRTKRGRGKTQGK